MTSCSFCDNIPQSLDGTYFCGVSSASPSESAARDAAMRSAREQAVKYLGEYVSTRATTASDAFRGYLADKEIVTTAAAGLATHVKDQKWCKAEPSDSPDGTLYRSRVLAFLPNEDAGPAVRATLEVVLRTRKAAGKLAPAEERQIKALMDKLH